jgi:hypothetical protein
VIPLAVSFALALAPSLLAAPAPAAPTATTAPAAAAPSASRAATPVSTRALVAMDRVEDLSEELANEMVDLAGALARRDFDGALAWFTPDFAGQPLFAGEPVVDRPRPGVTRETFPPREGAGAAVFAGAPAWLGVLTARLAAWRRIEDVRIKVKTSQFSGAAGRQGSATLFARAEGTQGDGTPAAITAWLDVEARFEKDRLRLARARVKSLEVLAARSFLFRNVTAAAGVRITARTFADLTGFNWNWQGAAAADVDSDGWVDLFVPSVPANHLYRNRADGTFEDVAAGWGVAQPGGGTGALFFDMDNDGDQDLFLCQVEGSGLKLFENTGRACRDVSVASGVARQAFAYSASAADVDNDGLLDVYVCCYNAFGRVAPDSWIAATNGTPNLLFRNLGGGRFEECGAARGVADSRWSYAAAFADFDGDGDADLAVANDYGDKGLFVNDGTGRFTDQAARLGALDTGNGMGVDWGDYDGDGDLDLYMMNMSSTAGNRILRRLYPDPSATSRVKVVKIAAGNTLLANTGGRFEDASVASGTGPAEWAWGGGFLDFDNDGRLDLFVTNGFISGKTAKDT